MTKDEIIALLKRKRNEHITASKVDHGHNTEAISNYESGAARGIEEAISIIGMLDKDNTVSYMPKAMTLSEFLDNYHT